MGCAGWLAWVMCPFVDLRREAEVALSRVEGSRGQLSR